MCLEARPLPPDLSKPVKTVQFSEGWKRDRKEHKSDEKGGLGLFIREKEKQKGTVLTEKRRINEQKGTVLTTMVLPAGP